MLVPFLGVRILFFFYEGICTIPQFGAFSVDKFGRFDAEACMLLRTGASFRLYHSQSESFVNASCDPEKDRQSWLREGNEPAHIPYLRKLPDTGKDPDPTDPAHRVAKAVWCFEPLDRLHADTVGWEQSVRIRHLASGRYLAVNTSFPVCEFQDGLNEAWYSTFLVDDEFLDDDLDMDPALGFKFTNPAALIFTVTSTDKTKSSAVPNADVSIRLEHRAVLDTGLSVMPSLYKLPNMCLMTPGVCRADMRSRLHSTCTTRKNASLPKTVTRATRSRFKAYALFSATFVRPRFVASSFLACGVSSS
jgi:hypothetical protein